MLQIKRLTAALLLLAVFCSVSYAADTYGYDPFNLHSWYINRDYESQVYEKYGNTNYNFFYQLRDITGASRNAKVGGPQWFATVYENYYYRWYNQRYEDNTNTSFDIYRRTMGGEIPDVSILTVGDLIDGFNFVFAEEPQPYAYMWRHYIANEVYDVYPDPVESLCFVITNGQGEFNLEFGNPYARHFPFWYLWADNTTSTTVKWWQQPYDWRRVTYPTAEPIVYIYSSPDLYVRDNNGRYSVEYKFVVSKDASGDVAQLQLRDMGGNAMYFISGDASAECYIYTSNDVHLYTVSASHDKVYTASNDLVYTLETDNLGDIFVCTIKNINESVTFGLDDSFSGSYTVTFNPSNEQVISSGNSLVTTARIRGYDTQNYGSVLGFLTLRQRASFAQGYTNYREYTTLPVVIANVANGNASMTPLIFDMTVFESNDVVNRIKFTWDAQSNKPDQDLGVFFMFGSADKVYDLETRITNRTGTRYSLYRYDMIGTNNSNPAYRDGYNPMLPDHWRYDLTPDLYGTLPDYFLLDAHSQIAPGLVTVYKNNIGAGYRTIDTQYDTSESFRLEEYETGTPHNLRLNYKRIGGMTPMNSDSWQHNVGGARIREFMMDFVDVAANQDQTVAELTLLMGATPAMIGKGPLSENYAVRSSAYGDSDTGSAESVYINASAIDAFKFLKEVPDDLVRKVSIDITSEDTPAGDDTTSNDRPVTSTDITSMLKASETATVSVDIPLQPLSIRMRIPRQSQLIVNHWSELDSATNSKEVFNIFSRYGTIWVRSEATAERDADLFLAINNKGSSLGVSASDCVRAFLYNDELYLDFIVLLADGRSINAGRTAYVEIFKDDNIPYILIGDGNENGYWDMTFYVGAVDANSSSGGGSTGGNGTVSGDSGVKPGSSGSGGGGCSAGFSLCLAGALILFAVSSFRKN